MLDPSLFRSIMNDAWAEGKVQPSSYSLYIYKRIKHLVIMFSIKLNKKAVQARCFIGLHAPIKHLVSSIVGGLCRGGVNLGSPNFIQNFTILAESKGN